MGSGSVPGSGVTRQCSYLHPHWLSSVDLAMGDGNETPGSGFRGIWPFGCSCVHIQLCLNLKELDSPSPEPGRAYRSAVAGENCSHSQGLLEAALKGSSPILCSMKCWLYIARG